MEYKVINKFTKDIYYPAKISLDTEYSEKNIRRAKLLSISVGVSPDLTYILEDLDAVQRFINSAHIIFGWNMVVDCYILERHGYDSARSKWMDCMLMEHLVDERLDHGLGDFALRECQDSYKDEFWKKYDRYQDASKEDAYEYEKRDGCYTYRAGLKYTQCLSGQENLINHVHSLQWALFDTEILGLKVNKDLMIKTKEDMSKKIAEYLPKLREEFDEHCKIWEMEKWSEEIQKRSTEKGKKGVSKPTFSFASANQVSWLVYESLEAPVIEKTKKGNPSTSYEALHTLSESIPTLKTLVDYKETKAVYSTFVEGMLDRVEGDRIYPGFFINGTATGRVAHNSPNMGNLPTVGVIRNFFIPDEGNFIVGADYSQIEVIVEANLTEDEQLLKIINEGASKHDITANGLGLTRDQAKTLNFALQYGAGVNKVSKILGVSHSEASKIFDEYWKLYKGVKSLKDQTSKLLQETGQVTNLFGRTRHFDPPQNEYEKAKQERQAYNHLIQGVGADITNTATYRISEYFKKNKFGRLWFSVHDEIICEVDSNFTEPAKVAIVQLMEGVNNDVKFKYPVRAVSYGPYDCWRKG